MKIYKETVIKKPLYITVLDNGITLFVYDGYAEGSDGRVYHPIFKDTVVEEGEFIGWKRSAKKR